jgi:GTP cyclohydrolase II
MEPSSARVDLPPARIRARVPIVLSRAGGRDAVLITFEGLADGREHLACICDPIRTPPLVRMHSECLTGDALGSMRCDCGAQLDESLEMISARGGILLYLRQEGRGIGLYNKLDAYLLQDQAIDTFAANRLLGRGADERDYAVAAQMLIALGIDKVDLITNNPDKVDQIRRWGIVVRDALPTSAHVNPHNRKYLNDKAWLGNHSLPGLHELGREWAGESG